MNKEISVQYAYKKDGKGERHGDQAERMLASQATKHGVQPTVQPLPAGLFSGGITPGPPSAIGMDGGQPGSMPLFMAPDRQNMPNNLYQNPPQQQRNPISTQPLPAPPSGLPARPPPSQAGYGGPQGFLPAGFNNARPQPQQGFSPGAPPPPGFGPPPSFGSQGGRGLPPGLPPGFQQPQSFSASR